MQLVATQLREGIIILFRDTPHKIMKVQHITPGKGRGMVQAKLRNLMNGNQTDNRFRSDERVEKIALDQQQLEFLYQDGDLYYFMNIENYEQFPLSREVLGETTVYLLPNIQFSVEFYEGTPVLVEPPMTMVMEVTETPPNIKGATASAGKKPATLETGIVVSVPAFIEVGNKIKIDTRTNDYVDRA